MTKVTLTVFILCSYTVIFALTAKAEVQELTSPSSNAKDTPQKNHLTSLLNSHLLRHSRLRRSPPWQESYLVQGVSRPFCSLFGTNRCAPYGHTETQCAAGYRYDYITRRCREIQNK